MNGKRNGRRMKILNFDSKNIRMWREKKSLLRVLLCISCSDEKYRLIDSTTFHVALKTTQLYIFATLISSCYNKQIVRGLVLLMLNFEQKFRFEWISSQLSTNGRCIYSFALILSEYIF